MKKRKQGTEFGVDNLIYDPRLYDGLNSFESDVPFYLDQARKAKGPVLELCCGTGRITLPLLNAGIDITGVDFTPSMLKKAKEKAGLQKLGGIFIKGDMRTLRLKRKFNLVFIPFNSIQNTYTLNDVEKVFKTVHAHMADGSRFVFDIFNPSIHYMVKHERLRKGLYRFKSEDGRKVTIDQICRYDSMGQVNRATWVHHIDGGKPLARQLDMRCFYPMEMDALLKYNGFKVVRKFGDFKNTPFSSASMKQIYICQK